MKEKEINVYGYRKDGRWHILLRHDDGREELSEQSWETREECNAAIKKYVEERGGKFERVQ